MAAGLERIGNHVDADQGCCRGHAYTLPRTKTVSYSTAILVKKFDSPLAKVGEARLKSVRQA